MNIKFDNLLIIPLIDPKFIVIGVGTTHSTERDANLKQNEN
jgi:hypothetical protein